MLEESWQVVADLLGLGLGEEELHPAQLIGRSFLVYSISLVLLKLGSRRLFGRASLFDALVAIMLGSIMSRGILGSVPILQTVFAGGSLVALHWMFATLSYYTSSFGPLVKGEPRLLIKDGVIQDAQMRQARISMNDLAEALRLSGRRDDISKIQEAYLERSGKISVIPRSLEPRIVETSMVQGVQRIRIEWE